MSVEVDFAFLHKPVTKIHRTDRVHESDFLDSLIENLKMCQTIFSQFFNKRDFQAHFIGIELQKRATPRRRKKAS